MSSTAKWLLFPHQLFAPTALVAAAPTVRSVVLVEHALFFRQYAFHIQKLLFHRLSMAAYVRELREAGFSVTLLKTDDHPERRGFLPASFRHVSAWHTFSLTDDWLSADVAAELGDRGESLTVHVSPMFLLQEDEVRAWSAEQRGAWRQEYFYRFMRKKFRVLVEKDGSPVGGKWNYDQENRQKIPHQMKTPFFPVFARLKDITAPARALRRIFPHAPGSCDMFSYAVTREQARAALRKFVAERLPQFGPYEDAMRAAEGSLFHSVLSPYLNVGLLTPEEVLGAVLQARHVSLASREGFIRQVLGWREYMRAAYVVRGRALRTRNVLHHRRSLPLSFYTGTTGIVPVDIVIQRVLRTAYAHHIERLMVLGNVMLLLRLHPHEVYRWFMELFIDAYDWVMVPNVYAMSQYADGGLLTTKPYISGSHYLRSMGDWPKGEWEADVTALYWQFLLDNPHLFARGGRMGAAALRVKSLPKSKKDAYADRTAAVWRRLA